MSFGSILYQLLLSPLTLILEAVYAAAYHFLRSYGAAIIPLSLVVNLLLLPFYNRAEKELAAENMKRMGVYDFADKCYRDLSGGQQQRVLLARALCATRRILLLDEPVSGLDPGAAAAMYGLIEELNKEGVTVIMVTHDISAAVRYASHILHIGTSVFFGTKEEYLENDKGRQYQDGQYQGGQYIGEQHKGGQHNE